MISSCQIAAIVPRSRGGEGAFNPDDWFDPKEQRKVDDFIIYGAAFAATQALRDAGMDRRHAREAGSDRGPDRLGHRRPRRHLRDSVTSWTRGRAASLPSSFPAASSISPRAMSRSCTASRAPITPSRRRVDRRPCDRRCGAPLALEDAEVMVAGGGESAINRIGIAGFSACKALSTAFNDRPKQASRPYDKGSRRLRDGRRRGSPEAQIAMSARKPAGPGSMPRSSATA